MTLEITSFFLLLLGYSVWEWRCPAHPVQRFAGLKLDLLSFVVALFSALASRELIVRVAADGGGAVNFGFVFCFWDRCFGTYVDGDAVCADYALGMGEPTEAKALPRMLLGV